MKNYKVISVKIKNAEYEMNRRAQEGWRVVSASVQPMTWDDLLVITLEKDS